uniref:Uncharacterized protein n=1 Tax=Oryza glumipatula TaxID=40148 RepID=A0A0D9YNP1_9ORYZ
MVLEVKGGKRRGHAVLANSVGGVGDGGEGSHCNIPAITYATSASSTACKATEHKRKKKKEANENPKESRFIVDLKSESIYGHINNSTIVTSRKCKEANTYGSMTVQHLRLTDRSVDYRNQAACEIAVANNLVRGHC